MGIRTKGYTKVSQKSGEVGEDTNKVIPLPNKESTENKIEDIASIEEGDKKTSTEPPSEPEEVSKSTTRVVNKITPRSPLKLRTPTSMARLGGMKVAARKLKKRKRSLFVQSANKILRSSIKSNKTRRPCRLEEKPRVNGVTLALPSRISTRTCLRRSSREGIPDAPLRTVELIQRPLELREPATKLLYMASLGLYPSTGESDMTPIVVIKELNCSPGKKNGVRKSLELPLIPYHKRFLDLANQDKQSISENIMPGGKQPRRDNRKTATKNNESDMKKPASGRKTPVNNLSPPNAVEVQKPNQGLTLTDNGKSNTQQQQQRKKKTPPPRVGVVSSTTTTATLSIPKQVNTLDLTASAVAYKMSSSFAHDSSKMSPNSNSKSLLKSNISPPSKIAKDICPLPISLPLNLTSSLPVKVPPPKPITTESLLASACSVTQAMNLIMSNITILPSTSSSPTSRKRFANDNSELRIEEIANSKDFTIHSANIFVDKKPAKKKQKTMNGEKNSRFSLPAVVPMPNLPVSVSANNSTSVSPFLQPAQLQYTDEALNLCMKKRNSEPLTTPVLQLPPKLQMNSNINIQKANINGSKPLNLIIPRPPPLMKAPLEATNFANCTQNVQPIILAAKKKVQPKKTKKSRSNNNQLNQSNLQIQETLPSLPPLPLLPIPNTDATVHAKSLLKCMNGEENTCAREIGESLDSVKTMLSRLQTRIGPAVNGVRLITIE